MPSAQKNGELALRLWEAIAEGDPQRVRDVLAPDVVWRSSGDNVLTGEHRGPDAVLDYLALAGETADELRSTLKSVYVSDDGAVLHYHNTARRGARRLDMDVLLMLQTEGDRVKRGHAVPVDQHANDAFWRP